jgi:Arylsulfotransferase (ASST)
MTPLRWLLAVTAPLALAVGLVGVACSNSGTILDAGIEAAVEAGTGDERMGDARVDGDAGQPAHPVLVSLSVSSKADGGAGVALYPTFSPDVSDYYVRCPAANNALTVSMTAAIGSRSLLLQPVTSPARETQTLAIEVAENVAIVAAATDGKATTEYWVRCLPSDMPELVWTTHPEAGAPTPGYYLVGNWFPPTGGGGYAFVLNTNGVPVWYARAQSPFGVADVDQIVAGSVSFDPFARNKYEPFELRQLAPLMTTDLAPDGYGVSMHEIRAVPDGTYLVFATPLKYGVDLTGLTVTLPDGGTQALGPDGIIQDCAIVKFAASGDVISVWLGSDHFDAAKDSTFPTVGFAGVTAPDGGEVIDPFHCNSIDIDPSGGGLLVSARNMDSIFYIAPSGAVAWKMGGAEFTKDGATYVSVASPFYRQHDARLLPGWSPTCNGGSGEISVFDDAYATKHTARGVVYAVDVGGGDAGVLPEGGCKGGESVDAAAGTAEVTWQYHGTENSVLGGSFRVSADGSRVIGWGRGGATNLVFTEVDDAGHELLEFGFADNDCSYRAVKLEATALDLDVLRNTAGVP